MSIYILQAFFSIFGVLWGGEESRSLSGAWFLAIDKDYILSNQTKAMRVQNFS
jgi:hypothetical protein